MPDQLVSVDTIAQVAELTTRRIHQMARENIIPRSEKGKYWFVACLKGIIKYYKLQKNDSSGSLTEERTRLTKALAEKTEFEIKIKEGKYLPAEAVQREWENIITACRARILAIPTRLAPVIMACKTIQEVKQEAEKLIYEALNELGRLTLEDIRATRKTTTKKGRKQKWREKSGTH